MDKISFTHATKTDASAIKELLNSCDLPTDGIFNLLDTTIVVKINSKLIGTVSIEIYGQHALLRSLAVATEARDQSIGRKLFSQITELAQTLGVNQLFLLTIDAENYFSRLGFKTLEREKAPQQIKDTAQFRDLCPSSAICMKLDNIQELTVSFKASEIEN